MEKIQATAVEVNGKGVLLRGPSGSGKSDLAVRLIDRGARLIADDYVVAEPNADAASLAPPEAIAGMLEIRGTGLVKMEYARDVPPRLVVDLVPIKEIERMPEPGEISICGAPVPVIKLNPFHASAPIILEMELAAIDGDLEVVR